MKVQVLNCLTDGESIEIGDVIIKVTGELKDILGCERTILNLMMRMSSIASSTYRMADKIKDYEAKIAATRKTTPGFRIFEKRAVVIGGGDSHRWRLDDMVLLKDTHLDAIMFQNNSLEDIVKKAKTKVSFSKKVEIEVENGIHALKAAKAGADIIMFDNMKPAEIKETIGKIKKLTAGDNQNMGPIFEASGNITLENVLEYAKTGVNIISSSEITLYPPIKVDLSLKIKKII
jgi:nicotinate-nucleotide pyrophosphorylase (carboxylating)